MSTIESLCLSIPLLAAQKKKKSNNKTDITLTTEASPGEGRTGIERTEFQEGLLFMYSIKGSIRNMYLAGAVA